MFYFVLFLKCFYIHMWGSEMRSPLSQEWYVICHWLLRQSRVIPELFAWTSVNKVLLVSALGSVFLSDTASVNSLCCMSLQAYLTMLDGLFLLQLLKSASSRPAVSSHRPRCFVLFLNRCLGSVLAVDRNTSVLVHFWTRI